MVCIMLVSNVLGTVQDIKAIARCLRAYQGEKGRRIHLHCDAVQGLGKIPLDLPGLDLDSATFSAHKFQGPRGTGILYLPGHTVEPLSRGGGQEFGIRGGTEHVAAIAAMNVALEESLANHEEKLRHAKALRNVLEHELAAFGRVALLSPSISGEASASPYICAIAVRDIPSEVCARVLDDRGFCVSSGSACSSNAPGKSNRLLVSTGISESDAKSTLRISFGYSTTEEEIRLLARTIGNEANTLATIMRKR
jgi:cysteine desulfurase